MFFGLCKSFIIAFKNVRFSIYIGISCRFKRSYKRKNALRNFVTVYKSAVLARLIRIVIRDFIINHIQPVIFFQIIISRIYIFLYCRVIFQYICRICQRVCESVAEGCIRICKHRILYFIIKLLKFGFVCRRHLIHKSSHCIVEFLRGCRDF